MNAGHPSVSAWRPAGDAPGAALVVPSGAGARTLRKRGWRGLQAELAGWAQAQGLAPGALRFVAQLPPAGADAGSPCLEPRLLSAEVSPGQALLRLAVPPELALFHGHFPTVPIVPGAQLAGWAADYAQRHLGWAHGTRRARQLKFRRIVQPGLEVELHLQADAARLAFRYQREGVLHAAGELLAP